ncbi:hypothetical protein RTCIAT899_CH08755 [Rhizobium tropici CIAT 899]|nr:hypothetical protein RTCIAT899_CH08755 [Rhizobium tropici CIAT 899]
MKSRFVTSQFGPNVINNLCVPVDGRKRDANRGKTIDEIQQSKTSAKVAGLCAAFG